MGRKASFDREKAVRSALKCFWMYGYDKTSLEDLLAAMEIKTSSFYHTFKSKEDLFFESVRYYRENIGSIRLGYLLSENIKGKKALEKYFHHLIYENGAEFPAGCFMTKTAANLNDHTSPVGKVLELAIDNLEKGFAAAITRGIAEKEFKPHLDALAVGKTLLTVAYGISALNRTNKERLEFLTTSNTMLSLICV